LREVEEIKIISVDTSQKGSIVCKVASENDIGSIVPEFSYRRQKVRKGDEKGGGGGVWWNLRREKPLE
jgi:hypothetical protein